MNNNDVLRQLRYALNMNDSAMLDIFGIADHQMDRPELTGLLRKEDEEGFVVCSDAVLSSFLDGLILKKRGRKEGAPGGARKPDSRITNNIILKKLRIALELKEEDMLSILKLGEVDISKSELSALFRKEGHKHYKECGDQFLRKFLKGLSLRFRG